ncbi:type IX secretion system membrane protein PorP/SprF [Pedobacter frigidisoli]|uniref:PorP/SprF family type IX secretion system membrane protein n=1 Tax=Pedobacter frigidisoli TaxID=2530455 RepID=UPI00292E350C|nr:type IX secretion system membrane protein PorP/SprF [Pedobacter frigidisoli]
MNKWFLLGIILLTWFAAPTSAQQRPQYTQYLLNQYLLNPALSGIENYTDVKLGYRQQWSGFEDAPKTSFATIHWALGDEYLWQNPLSMGDDGKDPRSRSYLQDYSASPSHHGVGASIVSDKAGQLNMTIINLSYAYHMQIGQRLNLAVGAAAGASLTAIDVNKLMMENPADPALANARKTVTNPDLSIGLWLYGRDFFAGFSAQQLIPAKLNFSGEELYNTGRLVPHYFLTSGYRLPLGENIDIIPSAMLKYAANTPLSADLNMKITFDRRIWLGAGYRQGDALSVMAGINVSHLINVTYSYDSTTSGINRVSNGSHEIVLGLLLNNVYKVVCPQRSW